MKSTKSEKAARVVHSVTRTKDFALQLLINKHGPRANDTLRHLLLAPDLILAHCNEN